MKTYIPKVKEEERDWYLMDADGVILGRLAAQVATILRGKHKPVYTPHLDMGDHVVIINAEKVKVTGKKILQKTYISHSNYPGGLKEKIFRDLQKSQPEKIIIWAVEGMLPHNRLGRAMAKKLKVYRGPEHPHKAQNPMHIEVK